MVSIEEYKQSSIQSSMMKKQREAKWTKEKVEKIGSQVLNQV